MKKKIYVVLNERITDEDKKKIECKSDDTYYFNIDYIKDDTLYSLAKEIEIIAGCTYILFIDGWENSERSILLHKIAELYNKEERVLLWKKD